MLADGGRVKGRHHPGLPALAPRADGAVERGGVHDVVVVGGELVPVLHHHVLHHLLDGVAVGEAGGVELDTSFALESLQVVTLLDVPDGLGLQDVLPAVAAPLAGALAGPARPVEPLVFPLDVLTPLHPPAVTEGDITAPTGQLQLAGHLTPLLDAVDPLEVFLHLLHDLTEVLTHPEPLRAEDVRRQTELTVDSVQVGRHGDVTTESLRYGDIEAVVAGQVLQQHLHGPGQGWLEPPGTDRAAEHLSSVRDLHVVQQVLVSLTQPRAQRADEAGRALGLLCLDHLTPAVQHLDLLTLQLLPQIITAWLAGGQLPLQVVQQFGLLPHLLLPLFCCQLLHYGSRLVEDSWRLGASSALGVSSPVYVRYPLGWWAPPIT